MVGGSLGGGAGAWLPLFLCSRGRGGSLGHATSGSCSAPGARPQVHAVMTRNIQDVLGQGERLDREPAGQPAGHWVLLCTGLRAARRRR